MNKKIYYAIAAIIFFLAIIIFYFLAHKKPVVQQTTILEQTTQPMFPVNDLKQTPGAVELSPSDTLVQKTDTYSIIYFDFGPTNKSYLISIEGAPIEDARKAAEASLLRSLGINQQQACQLTVSVCVSKDIDENLAGKDFGLSFCSNGIPFK